MTAPCAIHSFFHCSKCLNELPDKTSPEQYARLSFGETPHGFQLWCVRHEKVVLDIDLRTYIHNPRTHCDVPDCPSCTGKVH